MKSAVCLGFSYSESGSTTVLARFPDGPAVYLAHFLDQVKPISRAFSVAFHENLILLSL